MSVALHTVEEGNSGMWMNLGMVCTLREVGHARTSMAESAALGAVPSNSHLRSRELHGGRWAGAGELLSQGSVWENGDVLEMAAGDGGTECECS